MRANDTARRAAYSAAAGAASAALIAGDASGEVQYSGVENIELAQSSYQQLRLDDDEYDDIILKNYVFIGGNYQGATIPFAPGQLVGFSYFLSYASALEAGFEVGPSSAGPDFKGSLAYGAINPSAEFNNVSDAYIGFSFPIASVLHYAWVRVSINNSAGEFTIHDWAYESEPGVSILTGDTGPEGAPGDYNGDGLVDAADYTVWRDALGTADDLSGNGDETGASGGVVDQADYVLWRDNYGAGASATSSNAAPEPMALGLLAFGAAGLAALRNKRGRRV